MQFIFRRYGYMEDVQLALSAENLIFKILQLSKICLIFLDVRCDKGTT